MTDLTLSLTQLVRAICAMIVAVTLGACVLLWSGSPDPARLRADTMHE